MSKGKGSAGKKGHGSTTGAKTTPGRAFAASSKGAAEYFAKHPEQQQAVQHYTGYGYKRVNELLREGYDAFATKHGKAAAKATLASAQQMQIAVNRAAAAGHVFKGETLRGMSASKEQIAHWIKAGQLVNKSLWSTTVAKSVATGSFGGNLVLHIKQHSGVALGVVSHFKHEKEVLIPAGKRFKITKSRKAGGVTHLYLRQVT